MYCLNIIHKLNSLKKTTKCMQREIKFHLDIFLNWLKFLHKFDDGLQLKSISPSTVVNCKILGGSKPNICCKINFDLILYYIINNVGFFLSLKRLKKK